MRPSARSSLTGRHAWGLLCILSLLALAPWAPHVSAQDAPPAAEEAAAEAPAETTAETAEEAPAEALPQVRYVASMTLGGEVLSSPPSFSLFEGADTQMTLRDWLHRLAEARNDAEIAAVAVEIDYPQLTWAEAQELADAVARLNQVKPVYAFFTEASASHYLVASAARDVAMEPAGELAIFGLAAELTFFRDALDWLGVVPQFVQIGRFKGAEEPFTRTEPSGELKKEYNDLFDGLYGQMCAQIARQRKLTEPQVRKAIDEGPFDGNEAVQHKLVDRLVTRNRWRQQVEAQLTNGSDDVAIAWRDEYGAKQARSLDLSNPWKLLGLLTAAPSQQQTVDPTIAIIHADGLIHMGSSGGGLFDDEPSVGHETLIKAFDRARKDENIRAVIFRIDSPGGSALASELIHQAVLECDKAKPVIVSISSMAASGGYYLAAAGREIIADPSAIIGSIGVVSGKLSLEGLMDKLKIRTYSFTRGAHAGMVLSRPWTQEELAIVRKQAQRIYETFTDRVKAARADKIASVEDVAQGRIFTAQQAVKNGLVDSLGGLREAVIAAQKAAGVQTRNYIDLPRPRTLAEMLSDGPGVRALQAGSLEKAALLSVLRQRPQLRYLFSLAWQMQNERVLLALPHGLHLQR